MEQALPGTGDTAPTIVLSELTRRFGDFVAVDHVSFSVGRSEIFGLIGPNGAGKSTLMKMLTTLLPPTSGSARIVGYDIAREPADVRRHIGYVPQLLSADGSLTGYENLLLSARLYGVPRRERRTRITEALERMGLADVAGRLAGHYSGGMLRRLEIAESLLHRPAVLFLDEPTVGLDPAARDAVWDRVLDLRGSFRTTIVVTSHHMEEIDRFCDRIALISRGKVASTGTPAELKNRIGPDASLDDVFIELAAGTDPDVKGDYNHAEQERRAATEHG
ncbi:ABC transporter ATP-binding protein [Rhizobium binxianense]